MALWWIKGVQRESDEAIEYLLEADSEAKALNAATKHGIDVKSVSAYQGSTELSAIRSELVQIREELGRLMGGVVRRRNRLRDKPIWTIALGVLMGMMAFFVLVFAIWIVVEFVFSSVTINSYQ